jgi:hypothetical protein
MKENLYKAIQERDETLFMESWRHFISSDFDDIAQILVYCIKMQFETGVKTILDAGILSGYWLDPAIYEAICVGDVETLEALIYRAEPERYYILIALEKKHWHVAKFLAEKGYYTSANFCLPKCVECPELVEFFLKRGVCSDYIQSALQEAVLKRCKRSVEILLEHGANPTPDLIPHLVKMNVGIFGL